METVKLSLGISIYDGFKAETVLCLILALRELNCDVMLDFKKGTYVHDNRNWIVNAAIKGKATHLMFLDTDLTFPTDGIKKLIAHDKDIVGGMYNMKGLPLVNTIKFADENGNFINKTMELPKEVFKCAAIPTGFMLIKISCLDKIKQPYFEFGIGKESIIGEDVMFCKKATKAGIEIWCDPTILIGHIGDYLY